MSRRTAEPSSADAGNHGCPAFAAEAASAEQAQTVKLDSSLCRLQEWAIVAFRTITDGSRTSLRQYVIVIAIGH